LSENVHAECQTPFLLSLFALVREMRTVGSLKTALLNNKQRLLFVLTLCSIIYLHGYAVHLFSAW